MSYDLYVTYRCDSRENVNRIIDNRELSVPTLIALLAAALTTEVKYARTGDKNGGGYKSLVFSTNSAQTPYARHEINKRQSLLNQLGLLQPTVTVSDLTALPPYSTFLQFCFTLASPYISRDDEIFHINDNPVRKDKVFKVPMVAGTTWKGNLRWTATHLMVQRWIQEQDARQLSNDRLSNDRLRLTLLFGDEKGEGEDKGLAKYLDDLNPEAAQLYREKVRKHFATTDKALPNHAGRLRFYPTFFDLISLEVINPHDRQTRAGKQPIYFESVPAGASGIFSLTLRALQQCHRSRSKV